MFEALGFGLHDGQLNGIPVLLVNGKIGLERPALYVGAPQGPTTMPNKLVSPVHDVWLRFFALLLGSVLGNNRALALQDGCE